MMRFRYIDTAKLVFQLLRGNYAVRADYDPVGQPQRTTHLFRFCLACLFTLDARLKDYYTVRSKWYMLAACTPTYGQIARVLNYWYGQYGEITIAQSKAVLGASYLYWENEPPQYYYAEPTPPKYLGRGGNYTEEPTVNIPSSLANDSTLYEQFIADLNVLVPFYLTYNINII